MKKYLPCLLCLVAIAALLLLPQPVLAATPSQLPSISGRAAITAAEPPLATQQPAGTRPALEPSAAKLVVPTAEETSANAQDPAETGEEPPPATPDAPVDTTKPAAPTDGETSAPPETNISKEPPAASPGEETLQNIPDDDTSTEEPPAGMPADGETPDLPEASAQEEPTTVENPEEPTGPAIAESESSLASTASTLNALSPNSEATPDEASTSIAPLSMPIATVEAETPPAKTDLKTITYAPAGKEVFVDGKWKYESNTDSTSYLSGFVRLPDGRTVYYGADNAMVFGEQIIDGMPYNFDTTNGNLATPAGEMYLPGIGWVYLDSTTGAYATGFVRLADGRTVYYGNDHAMTFGEANINSMPYSFNPSDGNLTTPAGEQYLPGTGWVYLDPATSTYATGFVHLPDGRTVHYNSNHTMTFDEASIDGMPYSFNNRDGNLLNQTGETYISNLGWTYFNRDTAQYMAGLYNLPDGRTVYYNASHAMQFGDVSIDGLPYRFDARNGNVLVQNGEYFVPGIGWLYFDAAAGRYTTGRFVTLPDDRTVYYDNNGAMHFGFLQNAGSTYFMNPTNGNQHTGPLSAADYSSVGIDNYYLFEADGRMFTGWKAPDESFGLMRYFLPDTGKLAMGWQSIDGSWYYFRHGDTPEDINRGAIFHGWLKEGDDWYFLQNSGAMAAGGWVDVNLPLENFGRYVFFDSSGKLADHNTPFPETALPHNPNGVDCIFGTFERFDAQPTSRNEGRIVFRCNDNCGLTSTFYIAALSQGPILSSTPITTQTVQVTIVPIGGGEVFEDGYWRYKDGSGQYVTGFVTLPDGRIVYYGQDTNMVFGYVTIDGLPYYFNAGSDYTVADGSLYIPQGEAELDDGGYAYFDQSRMEYLRGEFRQLSDGRLVYYGQNGHRTHGNTTINGMPYQFDAKTGHLLTQTGEVLLPGKGWAYFNRDKTSYATGFVRLPDGRTVYYGNDSTMRFGGQTIGNLPFNFNPSNGDLMAKTGEVLLPSKGWAYFNRGTTSYATGFVQLPDGRMVYYGNDAIMRFGSQTINGMPYNFSPADGRLLTAGEQYIPGKGWAYLNPASGQYATGMTKLPDGRIVHYGSDYLMDFDAITIDGMYYFMNTADGRLLNTPGEQFMPGKGWVYLSPETGLYATGLTRLPDGRAVFYGSDHIMRFGEQLLNGKWYYLSPQDGHAAFGFTTLPDGRTVYYDSDAAMHFGWLQLGSNRYYLNTTDGNMKRGYMGWLNANGLGMKWTPENYYFLDDGRMYTGWRLTNQDTVWAFGELIQYFKPDGRQAFNWTYIDGSLYYFSYNNFWVSAGIMHRGWLKEGDDWHYLQNNGKMAAGGWVQVDTALENFGQNCYFDVNGHLTAHSTPWPSAPYEQHSPVTDNHIFSDYSHENPAPTCFEEGQLWYSCGICYNVGLSFTVSAPPHEFVYEFHITDTEWLNGYFCKWCGEPRGR